MSISTIATSGVASSIAIASLPVVAVSTFMPRRSSTLLSAKMLRASSSTSSTVLADQVLVGAVQPLQHALLLGRQVGDHAVQEQRRLVEQPLGRFDALDHDAARHGVQLRILFGRQLAAGEHDDRQVGERRRRRGSAPAPRSPTCRAAADRAPRNRPAARAAPRAPRRRCPTVTMSMSSWPSSSVMLSCSAAIVLDDQQPLAARLGVVLDARRAPPRAPRSSSAWS